MALLHVVVVPVLVATLLSGLLTPIKNRLTRAGLPKWLAVLVTFLGTLVVIAGLVVLVVLTLRTGIGGIEQRTVAGYKSLLTTLKASPLGITDADVQSAISSVSATVQKNSGTILAGALSGASIVSDILVGLVLSLFLTLFLLIDGEGIWRWCVRLAPRRARAAVDGGGRAGLAARWGSTRGCRSSSRSSTRWASASSRSCSGSAGRSSCRSRCSCSSPRSSRSSARSSRAASRCSSCSSTSGRCRR